MRRACAVLGAITILGMARPALGQSASGAGERRLAFDLVIGAQDFFRETRNWNAQFIIDPFIELQIRKGLSATVRPKIWRINGAWDTVLDQASVQYQFRAGSEWRIEAGRFPSPIGYGMTENRGNLNGGVIWWHRPYYMPLPLLGPGLPMVSLVSAVYPNGIHAATSTTRWDARVALVDRPPVEFWYGESRGARSPQVIAGGGLTPRQGLRIGTGVATGRLVRTSLAPASHYRLVNVEGELSFGYTKISGEWTSDRFRVDSRQSMARGWTLQAQHTITPRLFVHNRTTAMTASAALGSAVRQTYRSTETTIGYRVDAETTLRVGHAAIKSWSTGAPIDHQVGLSLIWARRWW